MAIKIFIFFIITLFIWGVFIEPNLLYVNKLQIKDNELKGLKVVFISDLHIKTFEKIRLKRIINTINEQNADFILLGGDYVSGHKKGQSMPVKQIAKELALLKSKNGTFAVIGNHDGWQGKEEVIKEFKTSGINVLLNNNMNMSNVCIAGVDDLQTGNPDIKKALQNCKKPILLLTHTPDIFPDIPQNVNLTLAGHLHAGQIRIPFFGAMILPSKYGKRYEKGLIIENNKKLFVTSGLGTSILPLRFNCRPEIVVIDFL